MSYLLIGLSGQSLSAREREWLGWSQIGGVVLFGRNFTDPVQLGILIAQVREVDREALVCVDQEGGPVQRFGAPCTSLPPLAAIGRLYDRDPAAGQTAAREHGALMATEMLALGVDLSFAPVLDLNGASEVIGERALHRDPEVVTALGCCYVSGMRAAGMAAVGKHFPGHGSVREDTHLESAVDRRSWDEIEARDLRPFAAAIAHGLAAVMMAHVRYPEVCAHPAGYSKVWIGDVLRARLGFDGIVISDDLGMRAADAGSFARRIDVSLEAGCDLVLLCRPEDVEQALSDPSGLPPATRGRVTRRLQGQPRRDWASLGSEPALGRWRERLRDCR